MAICFSLLFKNFSVKYRQCHQLKLKGLESCWRVEEKGGHMKQFSGEQPRKPVASLASHFSGEILVNGFLPPLSPLSLSSHLSLLSVLAQKPSRMLIAKGVELKLRSWRDLSCPGPDSSLAPWSAQALAPGINWGRQFFL